MRPLLALLLLPLVLLACVPAPPPAPELPAPVLLRREMAVLPGAVVGTGDPPRLSYPGDRLFAAGAALPLAGGSELLEPLAALLAAHPELRWQGTVRAATGGGAGYDAVLAAKRLELLQRFFRNRGFDGERLTLTAETAAGPPFELAAVQPPASAATSAAEKR
jgi:hypothetical protein